MWWHTPRNQISSFGESTSPFISAGGVSSVDYWHRGVRISGSNAGYTVFQGSVKGTGQFPPSLPLKCVTVCHHISSALYSLHWCKSSARPTARDRISSLAYRSALVPTQTPARLVEASWNVMAHAQKPDFVFRRIDESIYIGGGVSSVDCWQPRCAASAVVMLDTPCSEVVWRILATHSISQFPLSLPAPCVIVWHHISSGVLTRHLTLKIICCYADCEELHQMAAT